MLFYTVTKNGIRQMRRMADGTLLMPEVAMAEALLHGTEIAGLVLTPRAEAAAKLAAEKEREKEKEKVCG